MTTSYKFKAGYTKLGIATAPSPAPTVNIVNVDTDALVVTGAATTASATMPGAYTYTYNGAAGLNLIALFHTTDASMDEQDIFGIDIDAVVIASVNLGSGSPPAVGQNIALANMTLLLAETVSKVVRGAATAGTTTTLTDTAILVQPNGFFDRGSLWILSGAYTGATRQVSAYVENKLTFEAFPGAINAGVRYAVVDQDYPYAELVKAINNALEEIGPVLGIDSTLAIDSTKASYTLPTGVSGMRRVRIFDATDETSGYDSNHWSEEAGELVFDPGWQPTTDGWYLKLYYAAPHPYIAADTDVVNWGVDIERLKWVSAVHLLRWGIRQYGDDERKIPQFLQDAMQRADALVGRHNKGLPKVIIHAAR